MAAPKSRRWPSAKLTKSPLFCAVDLRDGNQALPVPLHAEQKQQYFDLLTSLGFKEIEVGFPAASTEEWNFCRSLVKQHRIPEDVTISVLTMAREEVLRRTFEALKGVRNAICHIYIPTSDLHVKYVLGVNRAQLKRRLLECVALAKKLSNAMKDSHIRLEFSPEEFTDSDIDFVADLCDCVAEEWGATPKEKVIINLPCTVERALPTHYADMLEAFQERVRHLDSMVLSLHTHNDMGCAVATAELGLLAGAQRVEGTLFGNGERAGNMDLVTLALNLQYLGLDTGLDFSNLEAISAEVSRLTSMPVHPRQPYAGSLVFTAFSGSHQDAIYKGLANADNLRKKFKGWKIPYLHINPADIGRKFEREIRITSQSGKGGIAYVLENSYGIHLPPNLLAELSVSVKQETERTGFELTPDRIWDIFLATFYRQDAPIRLVNYWPRPDVEDPNKIHSEVHIAYKGRTRILEGEGDGPVSAFAEALRKMKLPEFKLLKYEEHSIGMTVNAESFTIMSLQHVASGEVFYGIGFGVNIVQGAARAMVSSLNRMIAAEK